MRNNALSQLKNKISDIHSGDTKQLEAIFSDHKRLIIEAPAGYGKTKTMVSKIAYILASSELPYPKKILALTFSVNAAYKIKKDVAEQLPSLLSMDEINPVKVGDRVFVSNYHGFCRHVLSLYGNLIHENLQQIDTLSTVDESRIQNMTSLDVGLTYEDAKQLSDLSDAIKSVNNEYLKNNWKTYLRIISDHLLPNNYISYNAIILYVLLLFDRYPEILKFYQQYFPTIITDEFQDTNLLSYHLITQLISSKSKVILIGDALQRIYGFIGAIRNLMNHVRESLKMHYISLEQNYRFKDNPTMLLLDKNLRKIAENPLTLQIEEDVDIDINFFDDQISEVEWIAAKANDILDNNVGRLAILVRGRGGNSDEIVRSLDENGREYFYGLYRDDDNEYLLFHHACYTTFLEQIKQKDRISKLYLEQFYNKIKKQYEGRETSVISSLLVLLNIFIVRLSDHYRLLSNEDKIRFCLDTFENRALRQQMEYVDKDLILTTVHGAKGLEWEYVIIPDMEQNVFPMYPSLCTHCINRYNSTQNNFCVLNYDKSIDRQFIEELSVFYVAVTRAKRQVYFSASKERINASGNTFNTVISCFLSLPGISSKVVNE
ncbi:ATP-dependent helicase [candidate division KSB1 bacterium]|nr:ATP-dependent helicase [candidate division KSB1 bacterium]